MCTPDSDCCLPMHLCISLLKTQVYLVQEILAFWKGKLQKDFCSIMYWNCDFIVCLSQGSASLSFFVILELIRTILEISANLMRKSYTPSPLPVPSLQVGSPTQKWQCLIFSISKISFCSSARQTPVSSKSYTIGNVSIHFPLLWAQ